MSPATRLMSFVPENPMNIRMNPAATIDPVTAEYVAHAVSLRFANCRLNTAQAATRDANNTSVDRSWSVPLLPGPAARMPGG
jgi:hypothetical protein